uniref:Uncharacterized protein n=1 Tax=Anguilla anguilla TaxID=7936 RepID=A0A0E9XZ36_ANGAN
MQTQTKTVCTLLTHHQIIPKKHLNLIFNCKLKSTSEERHENMNSSKNLKPHKLLALCFVLTEY